MTVEEKMILAIQVGEIALKNGELPVGAVIFKGNEIVGKAYSSGESSKIYLRHAEMKVLWEVDEKGYSVRERKKMQLFVTLEPCMMCLGAAMGFFIDINPSNSKLVSIVCTSLYIIMYTIIIVNDE
ncbi:deaminase [Lacrimispora sp.]|uniref:deaminase n=1 Tax=Lacrimispora sp. TaxID=2719234 RepID=UPI00289E56FB|nr:deaminase [Lacrimispora sp.]